MSIENSQYTRRSSVLAAPPAMIFTGLGAAFLRGLFNNDDSPPLALQARLGRSGIAISAMAITGAGMALNWNWFTAIGAAPLILSIAPCAVMCAAGFCAMCRSTGCEAASSAANGALDAAPQSAAGEGRRQ